MKKSSLKPNILNIEVLDNYGNSPSNVSTSAVHEGYNKEVLTLKIDKFQFFLNLKSSMKENLLGKEKNLFTSAGILWK